MFLVNTVVFPLTLIINNGHAIMSRLINASTKSDKYSILLKEKSAYDITDQLHVNVI